jgi:hypothetical protein
MMIGDRVFREVTDNVWDPKRESKRWDRKKVSMQVLSTVPGDVQLLGKTARCTRSFAAVE